MLSRILSQQKVYSRHIQISGICGKLFKEDKEGNQGAGFLSQRLWSCGICNWGIAHLFQTLQYIFNLLCRGGFHHYGNPGLERPHVLAVDYKENAENQQINLLQSSRFGEALRITQDNLNSKNFYAFNPGFDRCKDCDDTPENASGCDCGCDCQN